MFWCVLSLLESLLSEDTLCVPRCSRQEKERGRAKCYSKCAVVLVLEREALVKTIMLLSISAANIVHICTPSRMCWGSLLPHLPKLALGFCCGKQECKLLSATLSCLLIGLHDFHLLICLILCLSPPCPRAVHPGTGITLSTTLPLPRTLRALQTCLQTLRRAPNR